MLRPLALRQRQRQWMLIVCLLLMTELFAGCTQTSERSITLTGSTSVTPFAEHLAEIYMRAHPGITINVQGLGSSAGIQAAENGTAEVGMSSRNLEPEEAAQLDQIVIAYDALAIIVNPNNPIDQLSRNDVQKIFGGAVHTWDDLQGPHGSITLVSREAGSGTFGAFDELLMEKKPISSAALRQGSNGAIRQIVADDTNAVGYISLGIVDASVKPVAIDGVQPSAEHVLDKSYTLVRPFLFVWRKGSTLSPEAQQFIDYVTSEEGQRELVLGGLVQRGDE